MNKLLVHSGGQPLYLDDLDFMQEAWISYIRDFLAGLVNNETEVGFVLIGVKKFGNHGYTNGLIVFDGELYKVPQHADQNDHKTYLRIVQKTSNPRKLKDGTTQDVYETVSMEWCTREDEWTLDPELLEPIEDILSLRLDSAIANRLLVNTNYLEALPNRIAARIAKLIDISSLIYDLPAAPNEGLPTAGGTITKLRGGGYFFQGQVYTSDQYVGETAHWESTYFDCELDGLTSKTVYVPMCCDNSIIPGKVSYNSSSGRITVEFWSENAKPDKIYNFSVAL